MLDTRRDILAVILLTVGVFLCVFERTMSRKSAAVGTGAMAFSPLVDILTLAQRGEYGYKWSRGTGMNRSLVAVGRELQDRASKRRSSKFWVKPKVRVFRHLPTPSLVRLTDLLSLSLQTRVSRMQHRTKCTLIDFLQTDVCSERALSCHTSSSMTSLVIMIIVRNMDHLSLPATTDPSSQC